MGCNCGAKNSKDAHSLRIPGKKVTLTCPDCEGGLVASNGMTYPVDRMLVVLPETQYQSWVEAGYPVQVVNEN